MQSESVLMLGVAVTLLSAGCFGRDFARPSADSLQLGKTTYAEIVARFGSPFREGTLQINDRLLKWTTYSYSKMSVAGGVTAARAERFYFDNLTLVGHEFTSSFREDYTEFDEAKVTQIKKGQMTQAEVIGLMGQPTGAYLYPLVQGKADKGLVYQYSQRRVEGVFAPKIWFYRKKLVVSIGEDGTVTGVQFETSGER